VSVTFAGQEAVLLLTKPEYHDAAALIGPLAAIHVVRGLYQLLSSGFELGATTRALPIIGFIGFATGAAAAFVAAKWAGAREVALATLAGWALMALLMHRVARTQLVVPYAWKTLALLLGLAVAALSALELARELGALPRIGVGLAACLAYAGGAYLVLMSDEAERQRLPRLIARVVKRFGPRSSNG
jgi:hypothetical protein